MTFTKSKSDNPYVVATCYACGTQKPISQFLYKEKDKNASTSIFKRWLKSRKHGKSPETAKTSKYQYRCVDPSEGTCPRFKAPLPAQPQPSNMQSPPAPAQRQERTSVPTSKSDAALPKPNTIHPKSDAAQPEIMLSVSSTRDEQRASRKPPGWQEREDAYISPSGFVIHKYKAPPKYSDQWCRDNDLY